MASQLETVRLPLGRSDALASRSAERIVRLWAYAFCLTIGPFLFIDGLLGLIFAGTSLRGGEDLPHRGWNFFLKANRERKL